VAAKAKANAEAAAKAKANAEAAAKAKANAEAAAAAAKAKANAEAAAKAKANAEAAAAAAKAKANAEAAAKAKANANAAEAARVKAEAEAATAEAARAKAEANAKTARNAQERNIAAKKIQAAFRESQAKKAAAAAARKAANNARLAAEEAARKAAAEAVARTERAAKARAAVMRAVALSKLTAAPPATGGRRAGLVSQIVTPTKKSIEKFFENFQLTGAAPTTVLSQTTKETAINNAWKFLSKSMLIPVGGSKYPNKLNWPRAVASLDQYNLTNAQKNLIRRVNIAVAAQPKKGMFEQRRRVKVPLSGNRNQNIAAHRAAIKTENEEERLREQARDNAERRGARASRPRSSAVPAPAFKPTGSRATYGMF
jgi:hypothetical protein